MKKIISILLCLAMVLPLALPATAAASLGTSSTPAEKTELVAMRSEYSKTYKLSDGTYQYVAQAKPIHYKDSTGDFQEINNAITTAVKRDGYKFTNTANAWNAHFAEKLSGDNAVLMTYGEYSVAFSLTGQTGSATAQKATELAAAKVALSAYHQRLAQDHRAVVYSDAAQNVDIAYTVLSDSLKEDIVIKSRLAPNTFKFRLTANGLTLQENNGTTGLYTADGKEVFTFLPLYMEDANGKRSENVTLTYTSVKGGYELTVTADTAFLNDANTALPVTVGLQHTFKNYAVTYDTYIDREYPTTNYYTSTNLWVGGDYDTNVVRSYLRFDVAGTGILPLQVDSAYIRIKKFDYEDPVFRAYRVDTPWTSSAITWNSNPSYNANVYTALATAEAEDWYSLDVTAFATSWLGNNSTNYGVMLRSDDETDADNLTKFYSSDAWAPYAPELVINYEMYYGSREYQEIADGAPLCSAVNCMGYALEYAEILDEVALQINIADMYGMNLQQMEAYIQYKAERWMDLHLGVSDWGCLAGYDSNIHEGWFRVVLRVGFVNICDGVLDECFDADDLFGYHWAYQTNEGFWVEKHGLNQSRYLIVTGDPTSVEWGVTIVTELEDPYDIVILAYDSPGVFYQIKDVRDVF